MGSFETKCFLSVLRAEGTCGSRNLQIKDANHTYLYIIPCSIVLYLFSGIIIMIRKASSVVAHLAWIWIP